MKPPSEYRRARRRWAALSLGTYVLFLVLTFLISARVADFGLLFVATFTAGIACLVTTGWFLVRWTQVHVADGRFFERPFLSAGQRFAPGLVLMATLSIPAGGLQWISFISGFFYSVLAAIAELGCVGWARLTGYAPPPLPFVSVVCWASFVAALFGFITVATVPLPPVEAPVVATLLILAGAAMWLLWLGGRREPTAEGEGTVSGPLLPRERLSLVLSAALDVTIAGFVLWILLFSL